VADFSNIEGGGYHIEEFAIFWSTFIIGIKVEGKMEALSP
jgi:hypothetical protein